MRKILFLTLLTFGLGCSNEEVGGEDNLSSAALQKGNANSSSSYSDYNVNVSVSPDGSLWTYTITKSKPKSKDLSHFIIDLNNCGDESASFADIVYATFNGSTADLTPSEGQGTGCNPQATTTNFVKINTSGSGPYVIVIQFDRGYEVVTADSWIKAGTSCNSAPSLAPGCPRTPYCSFSQGFFFANGSLNNGASAFWADGLTIGGVNYSHLQGREIWSIDRGFGGNQTLNGFFQLGAVRLSGVETAVQTQVNTIEAYFTAVGNVYNYLVTVGGNTYFALPLSAGGVTATQVAQAGGAIGTYVDANHCTDDQPN